jgi:hypothetical protein
MSIDATRTPQTRKRTVTKLAPLGAIVLAATASLPARAAELRPMLGMSLQRAELHGIAYYTVEDAGYSVVATLAGQDGTPLRFESTLLPRAEGRGVDPWASREPRSDSRVRTPGPPHAGGDNPSR